MLDFIGRLTSIDSGSYHFPRLTTSTNHYVHNYIKIIQLKHLLEDTYCFWGKVFVYTGNFMTNRISSVNRKLGKNELECKTEKLSYEYF